MRFSIILGYSLISLSAASHLHARNSLSSCDEATLNTTVGAYTAQEGDTLASISSTVNRGMCDIARLNRMADALLPLTTGEALIIPPETCQLDNSTCLITAHPNGTYSDCVKGGPHTYYTLKGDTIRYVALKLNITIDSLLATAQGPDKDADTVLDEGDFLKIPLCSPSHCSFHPYTFTYGTYKDIAEKSGSTVGQLMAMNPTYNHSDVARGEGPVLAVVRDCHTVGSNVTVIS
ncbi:unnamed protein product [Penicillium olsonii]|nr:unnamed protein product [Penicillium olsonii]